MRSDEESPILIIKNSSREGPGIIRDVFVEHHYRLDCRDLDAGDTFPLPRNYAAVIVMGGPDSAYDDTAKMTREMRMVQKCLEWEIPYLGVCLGLQVLAKAAGGMVMKAEYPETGFIHGDSRPYTVTRTASDRIFRGIPETFRVFQLHGDTVEPASSTALIAVGSHIRAQMIKCGDKAYGTQFHFELDDALFQAWAKEDKDLKALDQESLQREWEMIRAEYLRIGRQLVENFVSLIN